jgi:hypothetical protein
MIDTLGAMTEQDRQLAIQTHWEDVFSEGFVAFVQGQLEIGRNLLLPASPLTGLLVGMDPSLAITLKQQALRDIGRLTEIWDSMTVVYARLQEQSHRQGNAQGIAGQNGGGRTLPRTHAVGAGALQCYRCGSPAVGQGLCDGCLATQQGWEQDELDYDRQLQDRRIEDQSLQRLQEDRDYYDRQQDLTSYPDYSPDGY